MSVVVGDVHQCQCKHCGKLFQQTFLTFVPSPMPKECEHLWEDLSTWSSTTGPHGSRRCSRCGLYEQW